MSYMSKVKDTLRKNAGEEGHAGKMANPRCRARKDGTWYTCSSVLNTCSLPPFLGSCPCSGNPGRESDGAEH